MKNYLVDVPVRINIWVRPECQKAQLEVLKKARPSMIFLQSDGGRTPEEQKIIALNRKLVESGIDWKCHIIKIYEEKNLGLYAMSKKSANIIWDKVDRCIFLEDDLIPSVSFFKFCAELLERFKDDERIERICGMNHFDVWNETNDSYFFSRQGSIWGTATWKRCYLKRDKNHTFKNNKYLLNLLKRNTKNNKYLYKRIKGYSKNDLFQGHVAGSEFFCEFNAYANNTLSIVPKYNMINCWGCGTDAEHATSYKYLQRRTKQLFYKRTYEYDFPLKHNEYVVNDDLYEKKVLKLLFSGWSRAKKILFAIITFDLNYLFGIFKR